MIKETQLGFGGEFALSNPAAITAIPKSNPIATEPIPIPKEQLELIKEIPNLRIVKEGKKVYVPTVDGRAKHRAQLKEMAILRMIRVNRKKFLYLSRIPIVLSKYDHTWTLPAGTPVYAYSKQTKIPEKLVPEIIQQIQQSSAKARLMPQVPEVFR